MFLSGQIGRLLPKPKSLHTKLNQKLMTGTQVLLKKIIIK